MSRGRQLSSKRTTSIFEPLEGRTMFSAGALDPSFSGDGRATVDFGGGLTANANAVAVQSDGKTVVAGATSDHQIAIARFNLDGSLDSTFGPAHNGKVFTKFAGAKAAADARSVLIDSAGRIVVGGSFASDGTFFTDALIARYLPNGSLDQSFGNSSSHKGVTISDFGGDQLCTIQDMAIAPGGNIIVVGHGEDDTVFNLNTDMMVACIKDNGHTDSSFGDDGHVYLKFGDFEDAEAVAIDTNGSSQTNPLFGTIVVVGARSDDSQAFQGPRTIAIARLKANGSYDNTFDNDGQKLLTLPGQASGRATGVVIQPGGKMVISGTVGPAFHTNQSDFALVRLLSDGNFDSTFGGNNTGINIRDIKGKDVANDMIQAPDGGLLVGGQCGGKFTIVKYTADGVIDTTFGNKGIIADDTGAVHHLAKGPGRRFVAVGENGFQVNRYLDAGANLIFADTFIKTSATEGAGDTVSFFIFRHERLPFVTRVYLSIGGTARSPQLSGADYTGISFELPTLTRAATSATNAATIRTPIAGTPIVGTPIIGTPIRPVGSGRPYVDIPANATFAEVRLTPVDDSIAEGDETAIFGIVPDAAYEIGTPGSATVTIKDNDGVTLRTTADAYVRDGVNANTNFGSATDIEVKKNTTGVNRLSYLKFDLTSIASSNIGSVKLQLFGALNNTNQQNVATSVFGSNDTSWSETGITFNNRPATTGGAIASTTIVDSTPRAYTWDITAYVKAQLAAGHKTITLVLQNLTDSDPFATFASREAGTNGPQLQVATA